MKSVKWVAMLAGLVVSLTSGRADEPAEAPPPPATAPAPALSPNASEVVRLAEAGTSDDVVLAYIKNANGPFELSADQILYLRDIGVSSPVITAMLTRDNSMRNQAPAPAAVAPPPPAVEAPLAAPEAVQAPPPVYVSSPPADVSYFYDNLSPYGSWVQLEGIGWCWQPRVVMINRSWRPYCDSGHWVYTDAGWCWQSDYSWGWAPFHYGRWHLHERCGWVWLPDRVWGPAWVTWRYEGDHCGWAPLPPHAEFDAHLGFRFNGIHVAANFDFGLRPDHFTFIALRDFHNHDFAHHRLAPTEVTRIYTHTTVINNYVVKNNTIVNQGIRTDRVVAATHTPIHKVAIRDVPAGPSATMASRGSVKGEAVVYRPQLQAPAKPVRMVAQKVDDRHPVIQHPTVVPSAPRRPVLAESKPTGSRPSEARPGGDRAPAYSQPSPATPRVNRPSDAPSFGSSSGRTDSGKAVPPAPSSARPAPQSPRSSGPGVPNAQPGSSGSSREYHPLRSGSSSMGNSQTSSRAAGPAYYPKGHDQAAETHVLPPMNNGRSSDGNGRPGGPSRKNEP